MNRDIVEKKLTPAQIAEAQQLSRNCTGEAANWYRKAAEQGDAHAPDLLGWMYANGENVAKDFVTAYMWSNIAAAQGYAGAKERRDLLERQMTPAQIAEAQKLNREWKPKK